MCDERRSWFTKHGALALSLATWLGWGGGLWMATAIVPPLAEAATSRITITLERQTEETYETLERRAASVARAATQRSFDGDILVSEVVVTIVGANRGLEAPILTLQVSRDQWRNRPDPQLWATYFGSARTLLQIESAMPSTTAQPVVPPATATPAQPSTTASPNNQPSNNQPSNNQSITAPGDPPNPAPATNIPLPEAVPGSPVIPQTLPTLPPDPAI